MKHIAEHPEVGPAGQLSSVPGREGREGRRDREYRKGRGVMGESKVACDCITAPCYLGFIIALSPNQHEHLQKFKITEEDHSNPDCVWVKAWFPVLLELSTVISRSAIM